MPSARIQATINFEHGCPSTGVGLHLTDIDLIRKLIGNSEANHYMETEMIRLSHLLQKIVGEKVIVKKFEPCKHPIPQGMYISSMGKGYLHPGVISWRA